MYINKTANGGWIVRNQPGDADQFSNVFESIDNLSAWLLAQNGVQLVGGAKLTTEAVPQQAAPATQATVTP